MRAFAKEMLRHERQNKKEKVGIPMSIFSGLEKLGLGNMKNIDVYETEEKKDKEEKGEASKHVVSEEEVLFNKKYKCPVCDYEFTSKTIRTGKVKMISVDTDLRPKYQTADCIKYDAIVCSKCGYAALTRYFTNVSLAQGKLIKQSITPNFKGLKNDEATYSYEDAVLRYQLALANAVVKKSKVSERAYICLKIAWLIRGMGENLDTSEADYLEKKKEYDKEELEFIKKAYEGFKTAVSTEMFPICGMDEYTFLYVTADLARKCKDYQYSLKIISEIITAKSAGQKVKDRARELKEIIKEEIK